MKNVCYNCTTTTGFTYESRKLWVRFEYNAFFVSSATPIVEPAMISSSLIAHDKNSPIKWKSTIDKSKRIFYLEPVDETINRRFKYELAIHRVGTNAPLSRVCGYDGTNFKCDLPQYFLLLNDTIEMEIVYPTEALFYCYCLVDKPDVPLTKMITQNRSREVFCDVQFMVEDKLVQAHKIILADRSEVFYKMFTSELNDPTNTRPITVEDVTYDGFNQFIDIIYTGIIPRDPEICVEVLRMAEKYNVQDVKNSVEDVIIESISIDNAIVILITSDLNNAERIKKAVLEFCAKSPVHEMTGIEELTRFPGLMNEVFKAKHDRLNELMKVFVH